MGIKISEEQIDETIQRFQQLTDRFPDRIKKVNKQTLKKICEYIFDSSIALPEPEAWKMISKGNYYGYSCYLHESIEIAELQKLKNMGKIRDQNEGLREYRVAVHGKALFEQYKFLQEFIHKETGVIYDIVEMCLADDWDIEDWDIPNARNLVNYLKKEAPEWYNRNRHQQNNWRFNMRLRTVMRDLREGESL